MDLVQSKSLPKPRILNQIWKKLRCPIPAKSFRGGFVSEGAIHIQNRHGHIDWLSVGQGLAFAIAKASCDPPGAVWIGSDHHDPFLAIFLKIEFLIKNE